MTGDDRSAVLFGRGALRAERLLIEEVLQRTEALVRADALHAPIHVVVPSHSLRQHILTRLVAVGGRSLLGVRCSTHRALALKILENSAVQPPRGLDVFAILARRFARQEPVLAEALDHLLEGYTGMLGSVRDLLDAGFEVPHLSAVEEALEIDGALIAAPAEVERAQALTRITARILAAFDELGIGRSSTLLQRATDAVASSPDQALVSGAVLLHGFADATGVTADFLTALLRSYGGRLIVDRPPDPVDPPREDSSAVFVDRFVEHFRGFTEVREDAGDATTPNVTLFRALGRHAEVREVAHRIRDLLDDGATPEGIGVVLREAAPYRSVIRQELSRMTVPFSGHGLMGPLTPAGRRLRALQDVIGQAMHCHVERWLDALELETQGVPRFDLRVALAALGVARLEQLVDIDLSELPFEDYYPLPVRQGFFAAEDESEGEPEVRSRPRRVPLEALEKLVDRGRRLQSQFEGWRRQRLSLAEHVESLRVILGDLGWKEGQDGWWELCATLETVAAAPPIEVDRSEFVLVLRRQLAEAGQDRFGGAGAGVQVMGVIDARGRTFEHLFLLGLNRSVFPRTVREDPVLSDALRRLLERGGHGVLPDLPIKRRGYDEERYLFAHLISSSPRLTLSWLELDDSDRAMPASPLIERLRWTHPERPAEWRSPVIVGRHPIVEGALEDTDLAPRIDRLPMEDQATLAGLHGRESKLEQALSIALSVTRGAGDVPFDLDLGRIAAARIGVLDTLDPRSAEEARSCLSPYLGFVGRTESPDDPRSNQRMYVTAIERMATCPWQAFVERVLRIESVPDPLEALPRIDGLLIGIVTHRVLERIITRHVQAPRFEELRRAPKSSIPWPDDETLDRLLEDESASTVRRAGIALGGFAHALSMVTRHYLEIARRLDWPDGTLDGVLGAEIEGCLHFEGNGLLARQLAFRADRVDRDHGNLILVDYKTGRPAFEQKTARYRHRKHLREVGRGRRLQAIVYALAAGQSGDEGRFEFLRPVFKGPEEGRLLRADPDDEALKRAFFRAASTTLSAWDRGVFFPRLELPGRPHASPQACNWCTVAEACLKQDSGARRRLRDGVPALQAPAPGLAEETAAAMLDHWWLPDHERRPAPDDSDAGGDA